MRNGQRRQRSTRSRSYRVAALGGLFALLLPAAQYGQTLKTEFALPAAAECEQTLSSLAGAADGSFLAAWSFSCSATGKVDSVARAFRANATPASGDIRLNQFSDGLQLSPSVATRAGGGYVAAWTSRPLSLTDPPQDSSGGGIFARLLDRRGVPQGDEFQVNTTTAGNQQHPIAASHRRGFSILWATAPDNTPPATLPGLYFQRYDSAGNRQGDERLAMGLPTLLTAPRSYDLAHAEDGGFAVVFSASSATGFDVGIRLFAPDGTAYSAGAKVNVEPGHRLAPEPKVAALSDGRFVVVWRRDGHLLARIYLPDGSPAGPPRPLVHKQPTLYAHQVAADHHGGFTVAWTQLDTGNATPARSAIFAQRFDPAGQPREPRMRIDRLSELDPEAPQLIEGPRGGLITAWTSYPKPTAGSASAPRRPLDATQHGAGRVLARRVGRTCEAADVLCLRNDRFSAEVTWRDPYNRRSGVGRSTALTTDSGAFWFFDPDRLELSVKVLDGTEINGHFWVFYASLTNVEFDLAVTDRQSGAVVRYHNPPFHLSSRGDTRAFGKVAKESPILFAPSLKERVVDRAADQLLQPTNAESHLTLQERFTARVSWEDPYRLRSGEGQAVPITQSTGAFWFFAPNNLELLVKIIDGRAINGKYWLFYASLTNARFTLTVTDNLTGKSHRYENPAREFASHADTEAF